MPDISMKNMLEAGVHFGHQTQRWNPKMKPFIFGPRNGIYIIDLEKTVRHAKDACQFVKKLVAEGGKILFVATKKQARAIAKEAAQRCSMPHVTERWLGGTLTNFQTIRRGCERLEELERWKQEGRYDLLPKKEVVMLERKRKKIESSLGGVRDLRSLPSALFVIDPEMEKNAVAEANRLGVPVVAVVDTNCDPDRVDYVIPGNDDAIKSVTLFVTLIADACLEGSAEFEKNMRQPAHAQVASSAAAAAEVATDTVVKPATKPALPIVERVAHRQVKNIPTEFDYRDQEEDTVEESVAESNTESGEDTGKPEKDSAKVGVASESKGDKKNE